MSPGGILGHEFVGIVDAVGGEVRRFAEGDRVVGSFTIPAGSAGTASAGISAGVPISGSSGTWSFFGDIAGAQADYVRVPRPTWCFMGSTRR